MKSSNEKLQQNKKRMPRIEARTVTLFVTLFIEFELGAQQGNANTVNFCVANDSIKYRTINRGEYLHIKFNILPSIAYLSCNCRIYPRHVSRIWVMRDIHLNNNTNVFEQQCGGFCRYMIYRTCQGHACTDLFSSGSNDFVRQQFYTGDSDDVTDIFMFLRWKTLEGFSYEELGVINIKFEYLRNIVVKCGNLEYIGAVQPTLPEPDNTVAPESTSTIPWQLTSTLIPTHVSDTSQKAGGKQNKHGGTESNEQISTFIGAGLGIGLAVVIAVIIIFVLLQRNKKSSENRSEAEEQSVRYVTPEEMENHSIDAHIEMVEHRLGTAPTTANPSCEASPIGYESVCSGVEYSAVTKQQSCVATSAVAYSTVTKKQSCDVISDMLYATVAKQQSGRQDKDVYENVSSKATIRELSQNKKGYFDDCDYSSRPEVPPKSTDALCEFLTSEKQYDDCVATQLRDKSLRDSVIIPNNLEDVIIVENDVYMSQ